MAKGDPAVVPEDRQRPEGARRYRNLVWPVVGVLAGISFAIEIGGVANVHALPVIALVVALVVAGVAAVLGVTQSAWRGAGPGGGRAQRAPRNRNRNR